MVFTAGIIIGIGAAFFNPTILSAVPDLVPREKLVQANSFFSMIRAGSGIFGNSLGGILYGLLGAPLMFLLNGLSYLFSSFTEIFIRVPKIHHKSEKMHYWADMKSGLRFVWKSTGLRVMMISAGALNFFAWISLVLILPLFQRTPWLGPERYGIIMAVFTGGMLVGMLFAASVKIPEERRLPLFIICTVIFIAVLAVFPFFNIFALMILVVVIGGFSNAIVNVLLQSVIQLAVPRNMRGKVMGLLETLTQGLTPIGMAVGGLLGEILPLKLIISGGFVMMGVVILPQLFSQPLRMFFRMPASDEPPGETDETISSSS